MRPAFTASKTSINLRGKQIPGAVDRQKRIPGFDQAVFSNASVLCIGAGGIISQIAPTLVRKGIGRITLARRRLRRTDQSEPTTILYKGYREEQGARAGQEPSAGMYCGD